MSFVLLPVSVMANFIESIEEDVLLRILTPSHQLVQQIMLSGESDTRKENALKALVGLARQGRANLWLRAVAKEADDLQFRERVWITANIFDLHWPKKQPSAMPSKASQDIRLRTNPDIERRVENAATLGAEADLEEPMDFSLNLSEVPRMEPEAPRGPSTSQLSKSEPEALGGPSTSQVHRREEPETSRGPSTSQHSRVSRECEPKARGGPSTSSDRGAKPKRKRSPSPDSSWKCQNLAARAHRFSERTYRSREYSPSQSHGPRGRGMTVESSSSQRPRCSTPHRSTRGRGMSLELPKKSRPGRQRLLPDLSGSGMA